MASNRYNGAEAAAELGVDPSTITRWLKGKGVPSIKRVDELARVMGVPATDVAMALVNESTRDPMQRVELLLQALMTRVEAIEARQQAHDDQQAQHPSGRKRRPDA